MTLPLLHPLPSKDGDPVVFCVLVNWNGWKDTIACLQSLEHQDYRRLKVVVVDNASSDDSVARIKEAFPDVVLLDAGGNLGFAGGCNVGIRAALASGADLVWLLNNDTIAPPDTLTQLVAATHDVKVGITGTVLRYMRDPSAVQAWGGGKIFPWMGYATHFMEPARFGANTFLTFASVLIRKELFLDIGLMDEGYFMYFDDADFCFRARRAGWKLAIAEGTAVLHKVGGSADSKTNLLLERISTASGLRFVSLYGPIPSIAISLFLGARFARRLLRGDLAGIRAVRLGVSDWRRQRLQQRADTDSAPLPNEMIR
jgi:GT2 family glycosyltransferase